MIFIWGSYARSQTLFEIAPCSRCGVERPIEFLRTWRTGHFFFFPLFSFSECTHSRCEHCGREGVAWLPRRPLPFLDRFGWAFPAAGFALLCILSMLSVSSADHRPRSARTSGTSTSAVDGDHGPGTTIRSELDARLGQQDVHTTAEEKLIVQSVKSSIETSYRNIGELHVAAKVQPRGDGHKRAFVLVFIRNLRRADSDLRKQVLDDVRSGLGEVLGPDDTAVVGVKGIFLYGAMASS